MGLALAFQHPSVTQLALGARGLEGDERVGEGGVPAAHVFPISQGFLCCHPHPTTGWRCANLSSHRGCTGAAGDRVVMLCSSVTLLPV